MLAISSFIQAEPALWIGLFETFSSYRFIFENNA
jgi:hypothetical protein